MPCGAGGLRRPSTISSHQDLAVDPGSAGLMRAIAGVFDEAAGRADGPVVVVGLPAGERHELALLSFGACLRRRGTTVVYLGADVPPAEWVETASRLRARAAVIGVNSPGAVAAAQSVIDRFAAVSPPLSVWVGGSRRGDVSGARLLPDAVAHAAGILHLSLKAGGA